MEKSKLNTFISKYTLAGIIESVKWEVADGVLSTSFISDDKSLLGNVSVATSEFEDVEFGIYDTSKLIKMLSVLNEDIDVSLQSGGDNKFVSLKLKDEKITENYMLSDLSVIPVVPSLKKLPDFNIEINLDDSFVSRFIKAKNALNDESKFTFISKGGKSTIVLGHSNVNSNNISIGVETNTVDDIEPVSFSANSLKEILVANRDATESKLVLSTQGLAHISFKFDEFESNYYLVKVDV